MSRKKRVRFVALVALLALVAAACGGGGDDEGKQGVKKGGIYRMQTDGFQWNASFDPTAEYLGFAFTFYSNLLLRPLMGYKHVLGSKGGNEIIPDGATDLGQVSADGKTWTFKIKQGIKFAPPISRQVTSKDYAYAFERLANATLSAGGYAFYYQPVIVGMQDLTDGKAKTIVGIETPSDDTIVFKLTKPNGGFRYMMAMPATGPIPPEVGKCFTKNGEYGRFLIASGPYMLSGTDKLDASSCDALKKSPISGFDPTSHLTVVRNPNYDASTDTTEARENLIDGVDLRLNTNTDDIFKKIEAGQVDGESAQPSGVVLQKYSTDATLKDRLRPNPGDRTWYLFLNMTAQPFDDIHVRKAANYIVDKSAMVRARGGSTAGIVAEHIVPPDVLGGRLRPGEFDPYNSPGHNGDLNKAKAEMRQSRYDTNKDGICDAPQCKKVLHITRNTPPYTDLAPIIDDSFKKIGIELETRQVESFYAAVQVPTKTPAIGSGAGWGKDWADSQTFIDALFNSAGITKEATQNFAFTGLTADKAREIGVRYPAGGVPNIDADIAKCNALLDDARADCWAELDKKIMTDVVAWVPYLWANNIDVISKAVVRYEYDQFSGEVGLAHVALDPSKQVA